MPAKVNALENGNGFRKSTNNKAIIYNIVKLSFTPYRERENLIFENWDYDIKIG